MRRITGRCFVQVYPETGYMLEYSAYCSVDYYYRPGTMYRRNGDPGDPPEESYDDFQVEDHEDVTVYAVDEDGDIIDEVPDTWYDDNKNLFDEWLVRADYDITEDDVIWDYDTDDYYDGYEDDEPPEDY